MKYLFSALLLLFAFPVVAKVWVTDGDSLELNGRRVRLVGIDAPEFFQTCLDENKKEYACGKESFEYLKSLVQNAREVKCHQEGTDVYDRDLSVCYADGQNLNKLMIQSGMALTYRHDWYKNDEKEAQKAGIGLWRGRFMRPEFWRILHRNNHKSKKN